MEKVTYFIRTTGSEVKLTEHDNVVEAILFAQDRLGYVAKAELLRVVITEITPISK